MPKSKVSCSLQYWLRNYDKKLYAAAEEACVLGLLNPGRFGGITFLYPEDKTLNKKLISLLGENSMEGVSMFRSMIVTDYLPQPEDWMRKKDDIPNRLGNKVKVASGDRQSIKLGNDAVIKPLKGFSARADRQNMCVWAYKGKAMPLTGEKAERKYTKQGAPAPPSKKGGFFKSSVSICGFAKSCEAKLMGYMKSGKQMECSPHLDALCSYLCFLEKNYPDNLNDVKCMLGYCPEATFYNVFEPYVKNSTPHAFEEWINKTKGICLEFSSADKYKSFVNSAIESCSSQRVSTGNFRVNLLDNRFPQTLRAELCKLYSADFSSYSSLYSNNSMRKALHDETRFMVDGKMVDAFTSGDYTVLRDMFFEIECMQRSGYKNGTYIVTNDLSVANDSNDIAGFYSTAVAFLLSDCFVYAPYNQDDPNQLIELAHDENNNAPRLVNLYNVQFSDFMGDNVLLTTEKNCITRLDVLATHQGKDNNNAQNAFAQVLDMLDESSKITPKLRQAIDRLSKHSA